MFLFFCNSIPQVLVNLSSVLSLSSLRTMLYRNLVLFRTLFNFVRWNYWTSQVDSDVCEGPLLDITVMIVMSDY